MLKNKIIGVLMGGPSWEREISLMSGKTVANSLRKQGFNVVEIDIDNNLPSVLREKKIDIAFIALHGIPGEDGTVQGLLEIMNIPYTGTGVLGCSITMNKIITKKVLSASGIPTPKYYYRRDKQVPTSNEIKEILGPPPWIIKPVSAGSSVGAEIIKKEEDAEPTYRKIKEKYKDVFIEEFIDGMDITVGILEDKVLPVLELVPKKEFFDYEAKYTKGMTDFIVPARLPADVYKRAQELALASHKHTYCECFSRIDMRVRNKNIYVLEINGIPGLTEISALPAEAKSINIDYDEVIYKILKFAVDKWHL